MSRVGALGLVGCGHIGGSLAAALRAEQWADKIIGCDPGNGEAARALGLVDELVAAPAAAELTVLAAPVGVIAGYVSLPGVVTDVGSLKGEIVRHAGPRFVGGHPMAGTEKSGPEAADPALFRGKTVILTPTPATDPAALALVREMWTAVGARLVEMSAEAHDRAMAVLSQLPHVAAYALAATAGRAPELAGLAGGSLQSGTRVAASDVALWTDLLLRNREALLPWIDVFSTRIGELRAAIAGNDRDALAVLLSDGRDGRAKVIP